MSDMSSSFLGLYFPCTMSVSSALPLSLLLLCVLAPVHRSQTVAEKSVRARFFDLSVLRGFFKERGDVVSYRRSKTAVCGFSFEV